MPRRVSNRLLSTVLILFVAPTAFGQVTLTSSGSYTQGFNSIGGGLPTGWSVQVFANATSLGTDAIAGYSSTNTSWTNTTGQFANYASALNPGLTGSEMIGVQAVQNDRALGIRQTGCFGDPGAAFTLQLANTTGFQDFNLSFSAAARRRDARHDLHRPVRDRRGPVELHQPRDDRHGTRSTAIRSEKTRSRSARPLSPASIM